MMFEVQDLAVASPATVSRCGMVYVDPAELKWRPYVLTWMASKFPAKMADATKVRGKGVELSICMGVDMMLHVRL